MALKQSPLRTPLAIPTLADMIRTLAADEIITIGRNSITGQTFVHTNKAIGSFDFVVTLLQIATQTTVRLKDEAALIINPKKNAVQLTDKEPEDTEEKPNGSSQT